jgi:uncharacterized membrane protein (Fun14 family)
LANKHGTAWQSLASDGYVVFAVYQDREKPANHHPHGTRDSGNKPWRRLLRNRDRKKVAKLIAIVFGMFLAGLAYLQYQRIASLNWKLQNLTQGAAHAVINASQNGIPGVVTQHGFDSWGLPLTSGMAMGFAIGFMKG